jgi:hypothetical protein
MATTAISIAAATGAAAYLNAKYHLGQDIRALKFRRNATKYYEGLGTFLSDYIQLIIHHSRQDPCSSAHLIQSKRNGNPSGTRSLHK